MLRREGPSRGSEPRSGWWWRVVRWFRGDLGGRRWRPDDDQEIRARAEQWFLYCRSIHRR